QASNAQTRYVITDLGAIPGYATSEAAAVNSKGDVVGFCSVSEIPGAKTVAFLYSNGKMTLVGKPTWNSKARGINDQGVIVGHYSANPQSSVRGYVSRAGNVIEMDSVDRRVFVVITVNNRGVCVGQLDTGKARLGGGNVAHLFLFDDAKLTE